MYTHTSKDESPVLPRYHFGCRKKQPLCPVITSGSGSVRNGYKQAS